MLGHPVKSKKECFEDYFDKKNCECPCYIPARFHDLSGVKVYNVHKSTLSGHNIEYKTSGNFHQQKENNDKLTKHENTTLKTFLGFLIDF